MEVHFPLLYFPPVQYYRMLAKTPNAQWVLEDRYTKQTLRNRCSIYGANGKIQLSIPVERPHGKATTMSQAQISYAEAWQQIHWRSIKSAYGRAPYFEYFEHKIKPLFSKNHELLSDFLVDVNQTILDIFKLDKPSVLNSEFNTELQKHLDQLSEIAAYTNTDHYYQIFEDRHGFIPDLSVLDWVFHCGNRM